MDGIRVIVVLGLLAGPTYYAQRFIDYMNEHSVSYHVLDVNDPESYNSDRFLEHAKSPGTVMFTFNNIGVDLKDKDGENFWRVNDIPVCNNLVDHPRNFAGTLLDPQCEMYVFANDKDHVDFIDRYYPKVKRAYFSPNGGWEEGDRIPYKDRKIQVLYMGDCQAPIGSFPEIKEFEDKGRDFYNKTISYLLEDPTLSTEAAIYRYCDTYIGDAGEDVLFELNVRNAIFIESAVRRHFKLEGIRALDRVGVKVEIYGLNWTDDAYPFSDNVKIHDRIDRQSVMRKIGDSKISLCFIPWFKRGCSEKNLDSMLNGALCVTDRSEYLSEHYRDGYNIVYFDLNNPSQMAADVRWLLDNPDAAEQIAAKGYETAKRYDTWFNRYDRITETIKDIVSARS